VVPWGDGLEQQRQGGERSAEQQWVAIPYSHAGEHAVAASSPQRHTVTYLRMRDTI